MTLAETISHWRRSPFVWGTSDCIMSLCDHALAVTGRDPAALYRGSYADAAGAAAIIARHGGLVRLVGDLFETVGFVRVAAPEAGDVVVARLFAHEGGALWLGPRAAMRAEGRGVLEVRAEFIEVLGAWRWA